MTIKATNTAAIEQVPTHIITGFLGVGKTTAILNLLKNKPADERWAVLVNEFGEIGVDGALMTGQQAQGVFITEVAGGCMCCAAGVPMRVALNELLRKARPNRLLIEPTGLGHPKEVLQLLSAKDYQGVLAVQKTVTLVDARKLSDERYTHHETFNQQIAIADIVLGNKADHYQAQDKQNLINYVAEHAAAGTAVYFSEYGQFNDELFLEIAATPRAAEAHNQRHNHEHRHEHDHSHEHDHEQPKVLASELALPEGGVVKAVNQGEGFVSVGWRVAPTILFDNNKLLRFINSTETERLKAVLLTPQGWLSVNQSGDAPPHIIPCQAPTPLESRMELIAQQEHSQWQHQFEQLLLH